MWFNAFHTRCNCFLQGTKRAAAEDEEVPEEQVEEEEDIEAIIAEEFGVRHLNVNFVLFL